MSEESVRAYVCAYCSSVGVKMRYCSACRSTMYCSVQCQKKDWSRHQLTCGQKPDPNQDNSNNPEASSSTPSTTSTQSTTQPLPTSTSSTTSSTSTTPTPTPEPTQQLTHKESLSTTDSPTQSEGIFSTTNIIIAGTLSALAVAGWFAYSYIGGASRKTNQPQQPKGRKPPTRR